MRALERCRCYSIKRRDAERLFAGDAAFLRVLCRCLARRSVALADRLTRAQTAPLRARLAEYILSTADNGDHRASDESAADSLGASSRRVRALTGELRRDKLLIKRGRDDIIARWELLEAEARSVSRRGTPS